MSPYAPPIPPGTARRFASLTIATLGALSLIACRGDVITGPAIAAIQVSPSAAAIRIGDTRQFVATVLDGGGDTLAGRAVTWTSSATAVATVDATTGSVRAVASGSATITATARGASGGATVTVGAWSASQGFQLLSAGAAHTCGITANGESECWGANRSQQLGGGATPEDRSLVPIAVATTARLVSVAAGSAHTCGLTSAGSAFCWGDNQAGQLGDGSQDTQGHPTAVAGGLAFIAISAAATHTCALTTTRALYCWGDNSYGQLGVGVPATSNAAQSATPVAVARGHEPFVAVTTGYTHTCALTAAGQVYCWGGNDQLQLGAPTTGRCTVYDPDFGPFVIACSALPVLVSSTLTFTTLSSVGTVTCGLASGGGTGPVPYCWGNGLAGSPVPVVARVPLATIIAAPKGGCGLDASGAAFCWEFSAPGTLSTPAPIAAGVAFRSLTAGDLHTCGIASGTPAYAFCWGRNDNGQLGDGTAISRIAPAPVLGPLTR